MSQEVQEARLPAAAEPAAQNLSAQMFSNPQDFLQTLKDHFNEISADGYAMSLGELEQYASSGPDAKVRAAAGIAAKHAWVLEDMAHPQGSEIPLGSKITRSELNTDLRIARGESNWIAEEKRKWDIACGVTFGISSAVLTGATILGAPTGFGAAAMGLGALGTGAASARAFRQFSHENENAHRLVQNEIQSMNSWIR